MVIHPCAKFGMSISKSTNDLAKTQIHGENIILILRPKVKVINVCDTSSHGDTQTWNDLLKVQKNVDSCLNPKSLSVHDHIPFPNFTRFHEIYVFIRHCKKTSILTKH